MEIQGIDIDEEALVELQTALDQRELQEYENLIRQVPASIRREHLDMGKELKFSRPDFVRDILFTKKGFGFKPKVFTKGTMRLEPKDRIASTSAKDHLPYFDHEPFVGQLMDYQRLTKMRSTYVGAPEYTDIEGFVEAATGFFKYILDGKIHPSFLLYRTVTGRSASSDPNAQNFPKRGKGSMKEVVKAFRRIFKAPPGWKIIEADLSQAELRIAAWMANERTMLDIYLAGGDIHASTAASTMSMDLGRFMALKDSDPDLFGMKRFQAKAVKLIASL